LTRALLAHARCAWNEPAPHRSFRGGRRQRPALRGCRVLSAFQTATGRRFLIITEANRELTSILLPEDF
jgi:hypothetical protein